MSRIAIIMSGLLFTLGSTGCQVDPAPPWDFADDAGPARLRVTEIEVDETEFLGNLEVEVRLYDADTGETLGCTGQYQGMDGVNNADHTYFVLSDFVDVDSLELEFADFADRTVIVEVTERDFEGDTLAHCPSPPGSDDDIIGVSDPVDVSSFDPALTMQFGGVTHLVIGTAPTRL